MTNTASGALTLIVVVASLWAGHRMFGGFDETLPDALAAGRVQVKVTLEQNATESKAGERQRYSSVHVTSGGAARQVRIDTGQALVLIEVRRTGGWRRGELTLTIPAGTILTSGYDGYQRLATAFPVTVQLPKAGEAETAWVPVYCLDQHRLAPTLNTRISLEHMNLDDSRNAPSELGRLASCLAESGLPGVNRQQAVWLVAEGHLTRSREELRAYLHEKNLAILKRMDLNEMQSKVLELVRLAHPGASEDDQRSEAALYMRDKASSAIER